MQSPTPQNYWRGVILFGKNASTYKMALARLLLRYSEEGRDIITLDDLAYDFLNLYQERISSTGKPQMNQIGRKTEIEHQIDAIRYRGRSIDDALPGIKKNALSDMVLVRFNNLFRRPIPEPFYTFQPGDDRIILSKNILSILDEKNNLEIFDQEISGRWDLLEHAYERTHIVPLEPDDRLEYLVNAENRKNLTPFIPLLRGYQQDRCFYCGEPLYDTHVDHVIPYSAVMHNDVWNLVLAHGECNEQKLDTLPSWDFMEKLILRNEYYINSSHPLKGEIIRKLGTSPRERRLVVKKQYDDAYRYKRRYWNGVPHYNPHDDREYRYWVRYYGRNLQ